MDGDLVLRQPMGLAACMASTVRHYDGDRPEAQRMDGELVDEGGQIPWDAVGVRYWRIVAAEDALGCEVSRDNLTFQRFGMIVAGAALDDVAFRLATTGPSPEPSEIRFSSLNP